MKPEKRIPELDAARGICILGMVIVHLVYDLTELYPMLQWQYPPVFLLLKNWGGIAFFLISGIAVTLGRRHLRRGLVVFGCGLLVSTAMKLTGAMPIRFGVLHCLGVCMLLWPLFKRFPNWLIALIAVIICIVGLYWRQNTPLVSWLTMPFGAPPPGFATSDYFPLFPNLGFFLLGSLLGKTLYKNKTTRFPRVNKNFFLIRFLVLCGKYSLPIYLLHQPLITGILMLGELL
mgnify:CR=1 FL=1